MRTTYKLRETRDGKLHPALEALERVSENVSRRTVVRDADGRPVEAVERPALPYEVWQARCLEAIRDYLAVRSDLKYDEPKYGDERVEWLVKDAHLVYRQSTTDAQVPGPLVLMAG